MFRLRWIKLGVGTVVVAAAAIVTTDRFNVFEVRQLKSQITDLQRQKAEMLLYAQRLSASRRLAQINVIEQHRDEAGGLITVLRWQQIGRSGALGSPEIVEVKGGQVYFEAMVIKFEHDLIGRAAPGRETALALFRRAFGDRQAPNTGQPLDQTAPLEGAVEPSPDSLQARLWKSFGELIEDSEMAAKYGVRVAQFEAPSVPLRVGQVWEISLDATGGLNLRLIGQEAPPLAPPRNLSRLSTEKSQQ